MHELRLLKTPYFGVLKPRFLKGFHDMENERWEKRGIMKNKKPQSFIKVGAFYC